MSISITIEEPVLEVGSTLVGTEIAISSTVNMDNIIYSETMVAPNALQGIINREFTEGETYYIRATFILEPDGMQLPCDPIAVTINDVLETEVYISTPNFTPPIHTPDFINIYPPGEMYIPLIDLSTVKESVKSISVIVEDLDGDIKFTTIDNEDMLDGVYIDAMLPVNSAYIIRCSVKYKNNFTTSFNNSVLEVGGYEEKGFKVVNVLALDNIGYLPTVVTNTPTNFSHNHVKVIDNMTGEVIKEFSTDTNIQLYDVMYKRVILEITAVLADGSTIGPIFHYLKVIHRDGLPYSLPYALG